MTTASDTADKIEKLNKEIKALQDKIVSCVDKNKWSHRMADYYAKRISEIRSEIVMCEKQVAIFKEKSEADKPNDPEESRKNLNYAECLKDKIHAHKGALGWPERCLCDHLKEVGTYEAEIEMYTREISELREKISELEEDEEFIV